MPFPGSKKEGITPQTTPRAPEPFSEPLPPQIASRDAEPGGNRGHESDELSETPIEAPDTIQEANVDEEDTQPNDVDEDSAARGDVSPRQAPEPSESGDDGEDGDATPQGDVAVAAGDEEDQGEHPKEESLEVIPEETGAGNGENGAGNEEGDAEAKTAEGATLDPSLLEGERKRLRDIVHRFVTSAMEGVPCTLLAEGRRTATQYRIDSGLENFVVVSAQDTSHVMVGCRIATIEDVYSVKDDGSSPFPPGVISSLTQEELGSLLMVVFRGGQDKLFRFCLLVESRDSCSAFMEAMSCLHMYSQPQSEEQRKHLANETMRHHGGVPDKAAVGRIASKAADAAMSQQASVGYFLRCVGVQGGKGALGPLVNRAVKFARHVPLTPLPPKEVAAYLSSYGYEAVNETTWRTTPNANGATTRPDLEIRVTQHIEVAGHTWYMLECVMHLDGVGRQTRLEWQTPRRLTHLRRDLHDRVKAAMGSSYATHFSGARFARSGGLPGTTAALHKWSSVLAKSIRSGIAQPHVVGIVLRFLEAPSPQVPQDIIMPPSLPTAP